jgi:hypothetical protein
MLKKIVIPIIKIKKALEKNEKLWDDITTFIISISESWQLGSQDPIAS